MTVLVYDAIDTLEHNIPMDAPGFGYYVDGHYAWTPGQVAKRPAAKLISITVFGNPLADFDDCEQGDDTPAKSGVYAHRRHALGFVPGIYCNKSTLPLVRPLVADIPVHWWIADPGTDHIYPGSAGTQWGFDGIYDRSTFTDDYFNIQPKGTPMTPVPAALTAPCIGFQLTASGAGYWLFGADGGVFTYGDAPFYGSLGNVTLAKPIISAVVTPSGKGYYLIGRDYGVFTFGDAAFLGHPSGYVGP